MYAQEGKELTCVSLGMSSYKAPLTELEGFGAQGHQEGLCGCNSVSLTVPQDQTSFRLQE